MKLPTVQVSQASRDAWYTEYLDSEHWKTTRTTALKASGNRCQVCNSTQGLQVHHRTYELGRRSDDPAAWVRAVFTIEDRSEIEAVYDSPIERSYS